MALLIITKVAYDDMLFKIEGKWQTSKLDIQELEHLPDLTREELHQDLIQRHPSLSDLYRAGIPILYAHWEGFVKKSSEAYLNFVTNQGLSYNELKSCFIIFGLKKEIEQLTDTKASIKNIRLIYFIRVLLIHNQI